jgi:hypothetical protein
MSQPRPVPQAPRSEAGPSIAAWNAGAEGVVFPLDRSGDVFTWDPSETGTMAIVYDKLKHWPFPEIVQSYTERDTMLYALSLGLGQDPLDRHALPFVYEGARGTPLTLPTMPVVLGYPGFWMKDPASGIDWLRIVHGENGLTVHKPLPAAPFHSDDRSTTLTLINVLAASFCNV